MSQKLKNPPSDKQYPYWIRILAWQWIRAVSAKLAQETTNGLVGILVQTYRKYGESSYLRHLMKYFYDTVYKNPHKYKRMLKRWNKPRTSSVPQQDQWNSFSEVNGLNLNSTKFSSSAIPNDVNDKFPIQHPILTDDVNDVTEITQVIPISDQNMNNSDRVNLTLPDNKNPTDYNNRFDYQQHMALNINSQQVDLLTQEKYQLTHEINKLKLQNKKDYEQQVELERQIIDLQTKLKLAHQQFELEMNQHRLTRQSLMDLKRSTQIKMDSLQEFANKNEGNLLGLTTFKQLTLAKKDKPLQQVSGCIISMIRQGNQREVSGLVTNISYIKRRRLYQISPDQDDLELASYYQKINTILTHPSLRPTTGTQYVTSQVSSATIPDDDQQFSLGRPKAKTITDGLTVGDPKDLPEFLRRVDQLESIFTQNNKTSKDQSSNNRVPQQQERFDLLTPSQHQPIIAEESDADYDDEDFDSEDEEEKHLRDY